MTAALDTAAAAQPFPMSAAPLCGSVFRSLEIAARRYPDRTALIFYGQEVSYSELLVAVESLAAFLGGAARVARGDRVLLYMQNCPQFVIGYYAALRADAVIVPVNPMLREGELRHIVEDSGAAVVICTAELAGRVAPLLDTANAPRLIVADYRDYLPARREFPLPPGIGDHQPMPPNIHAVNWNDALTAAMPREHQSNEQDWCLIAYSSGTTGKPKGCLHTHGSVNAVVSVYANWLPAAPGSIYLAALPLFHVTGMQNSMNVPIFNGSTIVLMARWDRDVALQLIGRYRVSHWRSISTMMIDFLSNDEVDPVDLASLRAIGGGGAAMPARLAARLTELTGLPYVEGYGLSETAAATHLNSPEAPKAGSLGLPAAGVDARIIDPETLADMPKGAVGEIIVAGPQLFQGYWRQDDATAAALIWRDGRRYLRTGDLGRVDDEGYFHIVDRLKRMINVSGFKVWPAEIEAILAEHEDIVEVCVVSEAHEKRGEQVRAVIVPRSGEISRDHLRRWCTERIAAYKVPARFDFVSALPRSASGKVLWRELQGG